MVRCVMYAMREMLYDPPEIEYLDGRPYPKVRPKVTHGLVQFAIATAIAKAAGTRGFLMTEVRYAPGGVDRKRTELVPDVSFMSRERRSALEGSSREKPRFSPEIAVEVRSPSDNLSFLKRKIARYLATGSILVLDVVPATRSIIAYTNGDERSYAAGEPFSHLAVPWLTFAISEVFAALDAG